MMLSCDQVSRQITLPNEGFDSPHFCLAIGGLKTGSPFAIYKCNKVSSKKMNILKDWELKWNEWCNLPLAEKNKILDDIFDEMEKEFWPNEDGGES